ncbi:hypothetical protein HDU76_011439, partial [Blyttiomyces sp. JEL0837]
MVDPKNRDEVTVLESNAKNGKDVEVKGLKFDLVWYFIDRFQPEDERVMKTLMEMNIPFLVILAKCDAKKKEDVAILREQVVSALLEDSDEMSFEIAEMRNPQNGPVVCEECESPTVMRVRDGSDKGKSVKDGIKIYAWYCTNPDCDYFKDQHLAIADTRSLRNSLKELNTAVEVLLARTMKASTISLYRRAQLVDVDSKTQLAYYPIVTAVLASVTIGLTPIPFAD